MDDEPATLSRKEYELLYQLAAAGGRVLEREEIYQRVWGYTMVRGDRSVDVFVRKLRQKLERISPSWRYVHTHFGVGYRFAAEALDGAVASAGGAVVTSAGDAVRRADESVTRAGEAVTSAGEAVMSAADPPVTSAGDPPVFPDPARPQVHQAHQPPDLVTSR